MKLKEKKHIVVIGGGTGTAVVLEGLKHYPVNLSAIITTADDGSSSGVLRKKFDMIPPGDIRQCIVALASGNFGYLNERFQQGFLAGHTLGNLLITLFHQRSGNANFQDALDELLRLVGAEGSIIPMTLKPTTLVARLAHGAVLRGERRITPSQRIQRQLVRMCIEPKNITANPKAVSAIARADVLVVGPGNLFASIIPNFLISDIRSSVAASSAKKIYVANLFTQPGHTDGFGVTDFLQVLERYIGSDIFDYVLYNNALPRRSFILQHAKGIAVSSVKIPASIKRNPRFIGRAFIGKLVKSQSIADPLGRIRNPFLHDSRALARTIMDIIS